MWRHASVTDEIGVDYMQDECFFCSTKMKIRSIDNKWGVNHQYLCGEHKFKIDSYAQDDDEVYATHWPVTSEFEIIDTLFQCCPACGWWCIIQEVQYFAGGMPYMAHQWAAGALVENQFPSVQAPLAEIRNYLCAKYEQRFDIDPYVLEDVVASIFKSYNCETHVSSRSGDGGIDVFGLDQFLQAFGIQVKRYRRKIKVEQVRSFVGALTLEGLPKGIFVTTSDFTGGISKLSGQAKTRGIQLDCIGSQKLLEMLKVAQIADFDEATIGELSEEYTALTPSLEYGFCRHMGSL